MTQTSFFSIVKEEHKKKAIEKLVVDSTPDYDFFLMVVLSVLMATFGIILNNIPILIASMLLAPILSPILSLALSIALADRVLFYRSLKTLVKALVISVAISSLVMLFFFQFFDGNGSRGLYEADAYILYFSVAVIAGIASVFALVFPQINSALTGTAIAVALIPPVAAIGVGLAKFDWVFASNALLMFIINVIGIVFAGLVIFSLLNLHSKRSIIQKIVAKEEKNHVLSLRQMVKEAEKKRKIS